MKKQFTQLCIAMAILLGISTSSKAQYTLYLDTINNVCTVGSTVDISIRTKNFNNIPVLTYQGTVQYDTSVLELDSVWFSGKTIALNTNSVLEDSANGQFGFLWNDPSLTQTGQKAVDASPLATLRFIVKKLIIGNSPVAFDTAGSADISWNIGYYDAIQGAVTATNTSHLDGYVNFVSQPTISKIGTLLTTVPSGTPSSYQWSLNGSPLSGATSISYDFGSVSGSYTVSVNYSNGCTATSAPLLPVSLKQFTGNYKDGAANLSWSIASANAAYFNVQVSSNGKDFVTIKKVIASGTSYNFSDASGSQNSKVYYRLQIVESDGSISYSNVVALSLSNATSFTIYPNPVRNNLSLLVQSSKSELVTVQVVDMLGKSLHQEQTQLNAGLNNVSLNLTSLAKGNYVVILKGSSVLQQQFIKN